MTFKSNDYNFRPTGLASALLAAGAINAMAMVREPKRAIVRDGETHSLNYVKPDHRQRKAA